ncbi:MAG: AlwI family type II restriction endonuclease [Bacteroidales bacterium]|nr:AlwI family type II restriction endonuclease [Bacteroidales bacterium]
MAKVKNKALFFTTSPRSPSKMIPEIKLLSEKFGGRKWDKKSQIEFMELLAQSDFFEGGGSKKDKAFSARDRITRAPKSLGFINLKPSIELTEAGREFIFGKRPQEIFLRQLLKFQIPSPYHVPTKTVKFFVKPYLEIMRLIRDLQGIRFDELKIFGMTLTDYRNYDSVLEKIRTFRAMGGRYEEKAYNALNDILKEIYSEDIEAGRTKTRETADASLKKFLQTKRHNVRDYADACFRYLRYTELFAISQRNRSIEVYPDKVKDLDFILETVDRTPVFIRDTESYKKYLFDSETPRLYSDDRANAIDSLMRISDYTKNQLAAMSVVELKDLRDSIISERRDAKIKAEVEEIKSYALYSEIVDTYNEIISDGYYDTPLMLEYNTWRAMTMLDGGEIKGNFKFDDAGQPLSTAAGNMADIECDYGDFVLAVEVTMQRGSRQYESEGEPVARHFGQIKKRTGKETYCLFIAPTVNKACLAHFFALNKMEISYYGGKTKIIPLDLEQFMKLVDNSYNYERRPTAQELKFFLDEVIRQEENSANELEWAEKIQDCVTNWLD